MPAATASCPPPSGPPPRGAPPAPAAAADGTAGVPGTPARLWLDLPTPEATDRLGERLAAALACGDALLLSGPLGSGKTRLARALIRARLAAAGAPPEEVPSPSYTLVQTYRAGACDIWHADLYRLADPGEARELGLAESFGTALCLVEWPDRLDGRPPRALEVALAFPPGSAGRAGAAADDGRRRALLIAHDAVHAPLLAALARDAGG